LIVKVGDLLVPHPKIVEIDMNPVAASAEGCVALDAFVIVTTTDAGEGAA
jgi:hypothetical protein